MSEKDRILKEINEAKIDLQIFTAKYVKEKEAIEFFIKEREEELALLENPAILDYAC